MNFDIKMHDGEIATIFELIKEMMQKIEKPEIIRREPIGFKTKHNKE